MIRTTDIRSFHAPRGRMHLYVLLSVYRVDPGALMR